MSVKARAGGCLVAAVATAGAAAWFTAAQESGTTTDALSSRDTAHAAAAGGLTENSVRRGLYRPFYGRRRLMTELGRL